MKTRLVRWLRRYLPAECAAFLAAVTAAQVAALVSDSVAIAALAGAWAETGVYYAVMLARELHAGETPWRAVRNLVFEFGLAEALDSVVARPALMYLASQLMGDLWLGIAIGKLAADVIFYVPAITAFELRRSLGHPERKRASA